MSEQGKGVVALVEALSVLAIIVSLGTVAIAKSADLKRRDTATRVLSDIEVVRTAVYAFYSDSAYFPEESPAGTIPDNLMTYLPRYFVFKRSYGTLEYKNWPLTTQRVVAGSNPSTPPDAIAASNLIGITVITLDPRIGATAAALSPGFPRFSVGNKLTFVVFGS